MEDAELKKLIEDTCSTAASNLDDLQDNVESLRHEIMRMSLKLGIALVHIKNTYPDMLNFIEKECKALEKYL